MSNRMFNLTMGSAILLFLTAVVLMLPYMIFMCAFRPEDFTGLILAARTPMRIFMGLFCSVTWIAMLNCTKFVAKNVVWDALTRR